MNVEELLKILRDGGLDDNAIKELLSNAIASLEGPAENAPGANEEEAQAGKLLGVSL